MARTRMVCCPTGRLESVSPETHEPQVGSESSRHSKVAAGSFEEKVKVALVLTVAADGPESIVVSGGSTVKARRAGLASKLPAAFSARTSSSYGPGSRSSITCRPSHEPQDRPASSEHSKVACGSFEPNWKVAVELTIVPSGPSTMVVSGTTEAVPVTTGETEKLSTWPQNSGTVLLRVTSYQAPLSW